MYIYIYTYIYICLLMTATMNGSRGEGGKEEGKRERGYRSDTGAVPRVHEDIRVQSAYVVSSDMHTRRAGSSIVFVIYKVYQTHCHCRSVLANDMFWPKGAHAIAYKQRNAQDASHEFVKRCTRTYAQSTY